MKRLQSLLFSLGLLGSVLIAAPTAQAAGGLADKSCANASSKICQGAGDINSLTKSLINALLTILGAVAVISIVIGGLRYVTSDGDAGKIKSAKDVILYSVIGVIVAILSYAIVNFILDRLK